MGLRVHSYGVYGQEAWGLAKFGIRYFLGGEVESRREHHALFSEQRYHQHWVMLY
jgi:hypothetical protein